MRCGPVRRHGNLVAYGVRTKVPRLPTSLRQPRPTARMLALSVLLLRRRSDAAGRVRERRFRSVIVVRVSTQSGIVDHVDVIVGWWSFSFSPRIVGIVSESRRRMSGHPEVILVVDERNRVDVR